MTGKAQARKDLELCSAELSKYQNLCRAGLRYSELIAIDNVMIRLKERIKNLRVVLDGDKSIHQTHPKTATQAKTKNKTATKGYSKVLRS